MNNHNLMILRDFLIDNKELVEQHLDMVSFYKRSGDESIRPDMIHGAVPDCNTTCCLIGWCAHIPEFRSQVKRCESFFKVSEVLFNIGVTNYEFDYLFGTRNDDCVESAIKRLTKVINDDYL